MIKNYYVLEIKGGEHSRLGEVSLIKANPVIEVEGVNGRMFSRSVMHHYCSDTETFILPSKPTLINRIISELHINYGIWSVEMSEFKNEISFDETNGKRVLIHVYKGF